MKAYYFVTIVVLDMKKSSIILATTYRSSDESYGMHDITACLKEISGGLD